MKRSALVAAVTALVTLGVAAQASAVVLYDQYDNAAGPSAALTSQDFEAANDDLDGEVADDFVVPVGEIWEVDGVDVDGTGASPAASYHVNFYANVTGDNLPGAEVASRPASPFTGTDGDAVITFDPVTLAAGKYWVSVQARKDISAGQWFWQMRSVQSNAGAVFQNPADGYGTGCTTWTRNTECAGGLTDPDMVFRLQGNLVSRSLTVDKSGSGSGTVTSNPAGINCGSDCNETYVDGTSVILAANPAVGSTFTGWSGGGCTGTGSCTTTMDADKTVTAGFTAIPRSLTVEKSGSGSGGVTSAPAGIDCGADCTEAYDHGTSVTLTATPADGSTFTGWSGGGCTGTGTCVSILDADRMVTATFTTPPPDTEITKAKIKKKAGKAKFKFAAAGSGTGFECALAKQGKTPEYEDCSSPQKYKKLKPRKYTFSVRALGPGGTDETPAAQDFKIKKPKS